MTAATISRRQFLRGELRAERVTLRPPWALPEAHFVEACTRCGDCLRACPQSILRRGAGGFPEIDFARGECTFCAACSAACLAGALPRASDGAAPWTLKATIGAGCLALHGVLCAVCRERCAAGAISLQRVAARIPLPQISSSACTGCGACVASCPAGAIGMGALKPDALARELRCT